MTFPNQPAPDGAYVIGGGGPDSDGGLYGQDWTEGFAKSFLSGGVTGTWENTQGEFHNEVIDPQNMIAADLASAINDINLLAGVPAYGACFSRYNMWDMSSSTSHTSGGIYLPYNYPLGPTKNVNVLGGTANNVGGLQGVGAGLWEASVLVRGEATPYTGTDHWWMQLQIGLYDSGGTVRGIYQPVMYTEVGGGPGSIAMTYPFVVPEAIGGIPIAYSICFIRVGSAKWRKFLGGTNSSGMWLRRISTDTNNDNRVPVVADSGSAPP